MLLVGYYRRTCRYQSDSEDLDYCQSNIDNIDLLALLHGTLCITIGFVTMNEWLPALDGVAEDLCGLLLLSIIRN